MAFFARPALPAFVVPRRRKASRSSLLRSAASKRSVIACSCAVACSCAFSCAAANLESVSVASDDFLVLRRVRFVR